MSGIEINEILIKDLGLVIPNESEDGIAEVKVDMIKRLDSLLDDVHSGNVFIEDKQERAMVNCTIAFVYGTIEEAKQALDNLVAMRRAAQERIDNAKGDVQKT